MKPSMLFVSLVAASSFLLACSGTDNTGGTGTDTDKTDKGPSGSSGKTSSGSSGKTPSSESPPSSSGSSSSQTCSSASLNGRCTAGPKKGTSCCYAPESEEDPTCSKSNQCENVCEYCE